MQGRLIRRVGIAVYAVDFNIVELAVAAHEFDLALNNPLFIIALS
jgi:hypothetical protein